VHTYLRSPRYSRVAPNRLAASHSARSVSRSLSMCITVRTCRGPRAHQGCTPLHSTRTPTQPSNLPAPANNIERFTVLWLSSFLHAEAALLSPCVPRPLPRRCPGAHLVALRQRLPAAPAPQDEFVLGLGHGHGLRGAEPRPALVCSTVQYSTAKFQYKCGAVHCSAAQYSTVQPSTVQFSTATYSALQCSAVTVQSDTVHYSTVQYICSTATSHLAPPRAGSRRPRGTVGAYATCCGVAEHSHQHHHGQGERGPGSCLLSGAFRLAWGAAGWCTQELMMTLVTPHDTTSRGWPRWC